MRKSFTFLTLICAGLILGLAACSGGGGDAGHSDSAAKTDDGDIRIGVAGPFSGSAAAFGEMIRKGTDLKLEEINAAGGINGRKVVAVYEDDAGKGTEAANIARKLANDKSISLVIGHFNSTCSNAAKEEYNRKGVIQFSPGSTNVDVCANSPWTFRNLYRDDYQGTFLATYAQDVLGAKKAAVLFDNDDYGKGLMGAFQKKAAASGLEVLEPIAYVREQTQDFKPLLEKIKDKGVDVIFVAGLYNDGALITKAARQDLGLDVPILGGDGMMNDTFITIAGSSGEGVYVTTPFLFEAADENELARVFLENFVKKFSKNPDTWAALTYDAVGMALKAVEEVGTDREKIRDWMASRTSAENSYSGVTGLTYFDAEGDCYSKGAHVAVVKDGKFTAAEKQIKVDA